MRPIERRIAALEGRQGLQARPYRIFFHPAEADTAAFRRECEAKAPDCNVMIIRFVKPDRALHQPEGSADAPH